MYTSVNVIPYMNPSDALLMHGKVQENVKNATAEVVNGGQYVLVSTAHYGNVVSGNAPVVGTPYRIMGTGGLNLVGVYLGQPDGNPQPLRFKIGN